MKKIIIFLLMVQMNLSASCWALDGSGTVEQIKLCTSTDNTRVYLLFKLSDNNWFGVYGEHDLADPHHDSIYASAIMNAFSQSLAVDIRATYTTLTKCGVSAAMIWNKAGDYMNITK